ncbi:hypothetical protein TNCV_1083291 [Trichonephila clavipes]|nr:hypothetical protein TNCV_1083291 [Trichonephila clavipes]
MTHTKTQLQEAVNTTAPKATRDKRGAGYIDFVLRDREREREICIQAKMRSMTRDVLFVRRLKLGLSFWNFSTGSDFLGKANGDVERGQYGGCDPWLVTEWVWVRIPSKTWMYFLRETKSDFHLKWISVSNGKQRTPSVICWDHHL